MKSRRISPAGVLGIVVFIVVALAVAVLFDSPTSTWILLGLALAAMGISMYGPARRDRG